MESLEQKRQGRVHQDVSDNPSQSSSRSFEGVPLPFTRYRHFEGPAAPASSASAAGHTHTPPSHPHHSSEAALSPIMDSSTAAPRGYATTHTDSSAFSFYRAPALSPDDESPITTPLSQLNAFGSHPNLVSLVSGNPHRMVPLSPAVMTSLSHTRPPTAAGPAPAQSHPAPALPSESVPTLSSSFVSTFFPSTRTDLLGSLARGHTGAPLGSVHIPDNAPANAQPAAGAAGSPTNNANQGMGAADPARLLNGARLSEDWLRDPRLSVDIRRTIRYIEHVIPFVMLLGLVFLLEHYSGIVTFVAFSVVVLKIEGHVAAEKLPKDRVDRKILSTSLLLALFNALTIQFCFRHYKLWERLVFFIPPNRIGFFDTLWIVAMNDLCVRFWLAAVDCGMLLLSSVAGPQTVRKMLSVNRVLGGLYRSLLPIPLWYMFFIDAEAGQFFQSLMAGFYLCIKTGSLIPAVAHAAQVLKNTVSCKAPHGEYVSSDELLEMGDASCSICFGKFSHPVRLSCAHVFCEGCIATWLEQQKTCPMCRAVIPTTEVQGSDSAAFAPAVVQFF